MCNEKLLNIRYKLLLYIKVADNYLIFVFANKFATYISRKGSECSYVERPSDKVSKSCSRISGVTHGNRKEECPVSASGRLFAYHLPLNNFFIYPITFSMSLVFINHQQKIKAICIVLQHSY